MNVRALLFDADGVIQRPFGQTEAWRKVLGADGNLDSFLAAVFEAELPALEGKSDFVKALGSLLQKWRCCGTLNEALQAWTMIEADAEIIGMVKALRRAGVDCHLATNQEPYRASYMSETLGYAALFDSQFYSCRLRVVKPSAAYFHEILSAINVPAQNVLFLDDSAVNVASARDAGLHAVRFQLDKGATELTRKLADFGLRVPGE
jgi:putative hydrolase of the HAD superfamily